MKRYVIIAGETSGDQYGSQLMSAINQISNEDVEFWGVGGDDMLNGGLNQLEKDHNLSVVGFSEAFKKIPYMSILSKRLLQFICEVKPSRVILIDFPGFNLNLAKKIKSQSPQTKINFFISPQIWAWNEKRIHIIKKCVDQMIVIFPFEEKYYRDKNINAKYVGHPFLDSWRPSSKKVLKTQLNLSLKKKIVGIFPGSRKQELERHLPTYLEMANQLIKNNRNIECAIGLAPGFDAKKIKNQYNISKIKMVSDKPLNLLESCDVALVTSGTISLQASFMNVPCVVAYKLSKLSGYISKLLIKVEYISMANIVADKKIIPELIQKDVNVDNLILEINRLLADSKYYKSIKNDLKIMKNSFLNKSNAMRNAAKTIINEKN